MHRRKDSLAIKGKYKRTDQVDEKSSITETVDCVMRKTLDVQKNTSSDLDDSEHSDGSSMLGVKDDEELLDSMFAFMQKQDNEEVTLSDFKQNVNSFSIKKFRNLVVVLIDSIIDLITEKNLLNNSLEIFQDEKFSLVTKYVMLKNKWLFQKLKLQNHKKK